MKTYNPDQIRNFSVVGHASAGKTMLCESMLACGGVITRLGSIASGTTASDYHPGEQKRQISIHATPLHMEWMEKKLNILDCPGYADFMSEGMAALAVSDFALIVINACHGVELSTSKFCDYATLHGIPKILVVTAVDKEKANFDKVLEQARARFGTRIFPMTLPVDQGIGFHQVLDVLRSEVITYKTDTSGQFQEEAATGELEERVQKLHKELIEYIAESDSSLFDRFFTQEGLSEEEMRGGIHAAVQNQEFIPLFCTSGETNIGVARLLDFIAKYGSSPIDRREVKALDGEGNETKVSLSDSEPVLYVFKTVNEPHVGELSLFRVYSGSVKVGAELYNSDRKITERMGQIFILNGRNRKSVGMITSGDMAAAVKLRDTHTGNTLCSPQRVVALPKVTYPKPNIHSALKFQSKGDEDKIATGLATLHEEDPTFIYRVDPELHQTVISGQGELHLQVIVDRLKRRFNVDVELVEPKIPYRETIKAKAESKYRHKKQSGGAGQFAEVWMRIEPRSRNNGNEFVQTLTGQNVDRSFVPSVEKGVNDACTEGILAGYKVVDVKVDFYDGKMHPVDSKDIAFQIAGKEAFKAAFRDARPCLLEPIYTVEVHVPDECLGNVMGDLSSRRGRILSTEAGDEFTVVKANVPQKEIYHYSSRLRSLTGGRGVHYEQFSHYEELPPDIKVEPREKKE